MSYKTIAVILQNTEEAQRLLDYVLPLSKAWGAHIVGVHAEPFPVAYSAAVGFPDVAVIETAAEAADERTREIAALFEARMAESGQSHDWHSSRSFAGDGAYAGAAVARSADLVVVAQRNPESSSDDASGVEGVLYEAGRPVLVVPHSGAQTESFSRILVAWNGSKEAARATFDALPLIAIAEATEVFVVDPDEETDSLGASEVAAALSRHGAQVTVVSEQSQGRGVDEILRDRAAAMGADLVVLGAYSHSWLRQFLFGGVTRTVLQSMPVACLMSR